MDPLQATHLGTIDQIKFYADRTLKGELSNDARFYQVTPGSAHIQWLVGHMGFAIDRVAMPAFGVAPAFPDGYQPIFGWSTKPTDDRAAYPSWAEVTEALYGAIARLRDHVAGVPVSEFGRPLPEAHPFAKMIPARGAVISFTAMHTSYHLGQVSTLRRAQGLPSGMGV
jgi:hypothetical protein